jgi:hypothetical protein
MDRILIIRPERMKNHDIVWIYRRVACMQCGGGITQKQNPEKQKEEEGRKQIKKRKYEKNGCLSWYDLCVVRAALFDHRSSAV